MAILNYGYKKDYCLKFIKFIFILLIKFYQYFISPLFGSTCRYYPCCSSYAKEAFEELPIHIALVKTIWRILKCNPWSAGGYDPVCEDADCKSH